MARQTATAEPRELREAPTRISFSQLAKIHPHYRYACGRQYAYRYRIHLPERRTPSLAMGSAFDDAANAYFDLRMRGGLDNLSAAARAAETGITTLHSEAEKEPELFGEVKRDDPLGAYEELFMSAWAAFLNVEGNASVALIQDSHSFNLQIGDRVQPTIGYSDRVDTDGTIVDHKFSGSARWDKAGVWHESWVSEKRDQLTMYWLGRNADEQRLGGQPLGPPLTGKARLVVTYANLSLAKPQVRDHVMDLDLEHHGRVMLERIAEASILIHEGRYPARPGDACGFCSFRATCQEDEAARGVPFDKLIATPF